LWREGLTWLQAARAATSDVTELTIRAWLDAFAGFMATQLGQWDEAHEWLSASIELARQAGEPPIPVVQTTLAIEALQQDQPTDAVAQAEQAVASARQRNDLFWECFTLSNLSMMISLTTDEVDTRLADQAVEMARTRRNAYLLGHSLMAVGIGRFRTDPSAAIAALDEAIPMGLELARSSLLTQAFLFRGLAHLRLGHTGQAAEDFSASLREAYVTGNVYYVAIVLTAVAGMLSRNDSQQTAGVRMLAVADRLRQEAGLVGATGDLAMQEKLHDRLRETSAPDEFAELWTAGGRLTLDEAVSVARADLSQVS
jgi:hypothetical protein